MTSFLVAMFFSYFLEYDISCHITGTKSFPWHITINLAFFCLITLDHLTSQPTTGQQNGTICHKKGSLLVTMSFSHLLLEGGVDDFFMLAPYILLFLLEWKPPMCHGKGSLLVTMVFLIFFVRWCWRLFYYQTIMPYDISYVGDVFLLIFFWKMVLMTLTFMGTTFYHHYLIPSEYFANCQWTHFDFIDFKYINRI